jgi:hypothetical protein
MTLKSFIAGAAMVALTACGTEESQKPVAAPAAQPVAESSESAEVKVPKLVVTRVALDAEGNEIHTDVKASALFDSAEIGDLASAESAFASGSEIALQKDELDTDSSSQSWWGRAGWYYNTPWYPGKLLGRGLWWGANPYRFYANNNVWNYGYGWNYSCNNYRYYGYYNW